MAEKRNTTGKNVNENFFKDINELSSYWAGFIAADGCITSKGSYVKLSSSNKEVITTFKNDIGAEHKISIYSKYRSSWAVNPLYVITIGSQILVKDLQRNFKVDANKDIKIILPKKHVWDFLRGYFDGDGSVHVNNRKLIVQINGPKNLLEDIRSLCGAGHIMLDNGGKIHRLTMSCSAAEKLCENMYIKSSRKLDRKFQVYSNFLTEVKPAIQIKHKWTEHDINIISDNTLSITEMCAKLNRSKPSVHTKRYKLGITNGN